MSTTTPTTATPTTDGPVEPHPRSLAARTRSMLSPARIGAVYVGLVFVVIFTILAPDTFPTWTTAQQILNINAVTALMALSVILPLSCRVFDLSIGFVMTLSGVTVAYFVQKTDVGLIVAVVFALLAALVVGLINALVVVGLRIESFIATLATGSLIQAFITMVTGDTSINGVKLVSAPFSRISQSSVMGFSLPVLYVILAALGIWFLLEHTATGRRMYATGFNPDAARLQGIRTDRLKFCSLLVSSALAGAAGIVVASSIGSGSTTAGTPYLLTAFAAAFLGSTQLKFGRHNAWGTVIAVIVLGIGTTGLGLASAPQWSTNLFTGVVLIAALAIAAGSVRLPSRLRRRHQSSPM